MSGFRNYNIPNKGNTAAAAQGASDDEWSTGGSLNAHNPFPTTTNTITAIKNSSSSTTPKPFMKHGVAVFPGATGGGSPTSPTHEQATNHEEFGRKLSLKERASQFENATSSVITSNMGGGAGGAVGRAAAAFSRGEVPIQNNNNKQQQKYTTSTKVAVFPQAKSNFGFSSQPAASYPYMPSQNNKNFKPQQQQQQEQFPVAASTFRKPSSSNNPTSDNKDVHAHVSKYSPNNSTGSLNQGDLDAASLAIKFPQFNASEISAFHQQFAALDKEGNNSVHVNELATVSTKAGVSYQDIIAKLSILKLSSQEGYVTFEGFLAAVSELRTSKGQLKSDKTKIRLHGHSENITHTINEDEKESFVHHINSQLAHDVNIGHRLPVDASTMQIFSECRDGLILAKLINDSVPGTIDERVLNMGKKTSPFQMTENNNVVVNSAKAIGCSVVNIGSQDLMEGREHLILGLIWQIIRTGLAAKVDIRFHPELFRLLEPGETLEEFLKLPTDQILLRWFNYHLKRAGWHKKVNNFSSDVKDGENYTVLLNQLSPGLCSRSPLRESDLFQRAEMILENADKLSCRKYLTPKTLVGGNPKLNFAFVANLFNKVPGLEALNESEKAQLDDWLFGSEGDREARAFALWLNSLGVEPFVNNLYDDVSDGLILLQAIDHIHPGLVDWKKVNKAPVPSKFKKVENTNYVITLGKSMKFTLVGIQGSDVTDGIKILILGYVWQLMREHVIQTLKSLSQDGHDITDTDIIRWANDTVRRGGRASSMQNFKDPSLHSGLFLLDILSGMKRGIVDYAMVTDGRSDDNAKMNAKYAISIARKMGATIFVLPEDIMEVKPKMILTFVGTLMALDKQGISQ